MYVVGRYARSTQRGQDETAVMHYRGKSGLVDPAYEFRCSECSLSGCAPDVDPFRIENQYEGVDSFEG